MTNHSATFHDTASAGSTNSAAGTGGAEVPPRDVAVIPPALRFGATGNPFVVGIATAEVVSGRHIPAVLANLQQEGVDANLDRALATAVQQANDGFFHFHLDELHEAGGIRLVHWGVDEPGWGLTRDCSTRKLVVVVPLLIRTSDGTIRVRFPDLGREETLSAGMAVMFPAYLYPVVDVEDGAEVVLAVTHALGNAFQ